MWASVTRLGDLLYFGQLFKPCGNNYFAQIPHFRQFLGNFYRHLATFCWSNWACGTVVRGSNPMIGNFDMTIRRKVKNREKVTH